jgi:murein DD-endopeptidase MepM/ murein hydrolase activator NlpD
MLVRAPVLAIVVAAACLGWLAPGALAAPRADVAALQVALRSAGTYGGTVDGIRGPGTVAAVRSLQARVGLPVDGVAGRRTRRALGRLGRHLYGSRPLALGQIGWDVAALQFKLAIHGFPSGSFDGALGPRSIRALQRFQVWAGLPADGVAGAGTWRALRAPPPRSPVKLLRPVNAVVGDRFGPRDDRFHAGADFPAPTGTPVTAAGFGDVVFSGYDAGGWGNMVIVRHRFGLRTLYAHLSSIAVATGAPVGAGQLVGRVGQTGHATGPHLHFELLLRGANVDPLSAL